MKKALAAVAVVIIIIIAVVGAVYYFGLFGKIFGANGGEETTTPNHPPVPIINANNTSPRVNENVTLDAFSSYDPDDDNITEYTWDFGDGGSGIGVEVIHNWSVPGNYTVILTVKDEKGNANSTSTNITVRRENAPIGPFTGIEISYENPVINSTNKHPFDVEEGAVNATFTLTVNSGNGELNLTVQSPSGIELIKETISVTIQFSKDYSIPEENLQEIGEYLIVVTCTDGAIIYDIEGQVEY